MRLEPCSNVVMTAVLRLLQNRCCLFEQDMEMGFEMAIAIAMAGMTVAVVEDQYGRNGKRRRILTGTAQYYDPLWTALGNELLRRPGAARFVASETISPSRGRGEAGGG